MTPGDAEAGAYRVDEVEALDGDVRFCLVLPCEAVSVPVMRRVLGGTLLGFGADEECVADILLAATKACTNVLKHDPRCSEYEVSASVGKDDCFLEIANVSPGKNTRLPEERNPMWPAVCPGVSSTRTWCCGVNTTAGSRPPTSRPWRQRCRPAGSWSCLESDIR